MFVNVNGADNANVVYDKSEFKNEIREWLKLDEHAIHNKIQRIKTDLMPEYVRTRVSPPGKRSAPIPPPSEGGSDQNHARPIPPRIPRGPPVDESEMKVRIDQFRSANGEKLDEFNILIEVGCFKFPNSCNRFKAIFPEHFKNPKLPNDRSPNHATPPHLQKPGPDGRGNLRPTHPAGTPQSLPPHPARTADVADWVALDSSTKRRALYADKGDFDAVVKEVVKEIGFHQHSDL